MRILAIDPGVQTGCAYFVDGKLSTLWTMNGHEIGDEMFHDIVDMVVFEDSTLISNVFTTARAGQLKIARNIGEVDGLCKRIRYLCEKAKLPFIQVSPKQKGKKLNAKEFQERTGYDRQTNQHERDAAIVGFVYRNAFQQKTN